MAWERWGAAMERALYGPDGFYTAGTGAPGHDFRTSSTASPHFARALLRLAAHVDAALDFPDPFTLVEVAAARGALLAAFAHHVPTECPQLAGRLRLVGVDLAPRPDGLPDGVEWVRDVGDLRLFDGLLLANEWLDNVPCDVVEMTEAYAAYVEVDERGNERVGERVDRADQLWLDRWWPLVDEGERAELGAARDAAWCRAVSKLDRGVAVCVDYAHDLGDREAGLVAAGTLTGYRDGRQVAPVPDGTCDITAHVALDAVAAAGAAVGASASALLDQRTALRALGVTGGRPDLALASSDPHAYLRALGGAGEEAELIARGGLGDFGWLVQAVGVELPRVLVPGAGPSAGTESPGLPMS
ncbi:MAG TPA: SAM-dependent methyltransferase [Mycobacteriales bacterium]|jgi:SAM-dependent MidA family methyltransferase|nr:SAM-dependent methyltransferase [Mycobacteriales bacterium]